MKEVFETYPLAAWSVVSVLLAAIVIMTLWEQVKWWWFNTWVRFPLLGRIARLSRDLNEDSSLPGWHKGESTLCLEYKKFIHIQDEHDFNEKVTYLTKAGDNGRKATPYWIWLLTISMVFVEAMGFSYVLAGYTLPGASENLQQTGAYGIAFLISVILVAFTHLAGHELYKSERVNLARRQWNEAGRKQELFTGTVPLARPQSSDDHKPTFTQLCNRVGSHPSYKVTVLTVIFVLLVASLATYVRGQVLERELEARVTLSSNQAGNDARSAAGSLDMSATNVRLPADDDAANRAADRKAVSDEADIDRHGGWATFIVLAFVFVFLQILGVIFGYRWGFAGENSQEAYRDIGSGRYSSYSAVREHYRRIADTAQASLATLQQKMMMHNSTHGTSGQHLSKTFRDFMQQTRLADAAERESERTYAQTVAAQQAQPLHVPAAPVAAPAVVAVAAVVPPPPAAAPAAPVQVVTDSLQEVMARLDALGEDKEAKKKLMAQLPEELNASVRDELKRRKEERERKAREADAELEDLL
ncbi:hypothetical protein [Herbaspirillum seropedicae]|uniref:hypothetical protein n=1 Tax=Herbaspirillum seropedicae TaxID=964 RepID=UPI002857569E|nr:hypothetical protein [Herbaspirillum seropedicae]MDR6395581.1 hypothetical protein [Herbaspirillum seropedicae]